MTKILFSVDLLKYYVNKFNCIDKGIPPIQIISRPATGNVLIFKVLPAISSKIFPTLLISKLFSLSNFLTMYNLIYSINVSTCWIDLTFLLPVCPFIWCQVECPLIFSVHLHSNQDFFFFNATLVMILREVTNVISGLKVTPRTLEIKFHKNINNMGEWFFKRK